MYLVVFMLIMSSCGSQDYVKFKEDDPFIIGMIEKTNDGVKYIEKDFSLTGSESFSVRKGHVLSDVDLGYEVGDTLRLEVKRINR